MPKPLPLYSDYRRCTNEQVDRRDAGDWSRKETGNQKRRHSDFKRNGRIGELPRGPESSGVEKIKGGIPGSELPDGVWDEKQAANNAQNHQRRWDVEAEHPYSAHSWPTR
jgi:hypothetical protein